MNNFLMAISIGVVAGLIDIVPMILKRMDKYAISSAFIHWVGLGVIISYLDWNIQPYLKGIVVALITALPLIIIVYPNDKKAFIPMIIFSVILGAGVGIASAQLVG